MVTINYVLVPPTGIRAAIEDHRTAWAAYQVAPDADVDWHAAASACDAMDEALSRLVGTPCQNLDEARALAAYLFWYVNAERLTRNWMELPESAALARASDLALLLPADALGGDLDHPHLALGVLVARVVRWLRPACEEVSSDLRAPPATCGQGAAQGTFITKVLPLYDRQPSFVPADEPLPGEDEPWTVLAPVRPNTEHVRAPRVLDVVGQAFAAFALVAGGAVLTGLAALL